MPKNGGSVLKMIMKNEPENMYYEGDFQVAEYEDEETFEAVVIKRVVRDE